MSFSLRPSLSLRLKFVPVSPWPSFKLCLFQRQVHAVLPAWQDVPLLPPASTGSPHLGLPLGEASPDHSLYTRAHDYKCGLWGNSPFPSSRYHCVEIHIYPCDSSRCNVCLHLWNGSPMKAGALAISLMLLCLLCLASFLSYGLCSINIC